MIKKENYNKGFTLIEILVVIGIIAVLAAIVIIAINPARQFAQARNSQRTANLNAILNAMGQYVADHKGELPTEMNDVDDDEDQEIKSSDVDLCEDLVPDYLPALLVDPEVNSGPVAEDDCDGSYNTQYTIKKLDNQRIEICAPNAEDEEAIEDAEEICVTR